MAILSNFYGIFNYFQSQYTMKARVYRNKRISKKNNKYGDWQFDQCEVGSHTSHELSSIHQTHIVQENNFELCVSIS